MTFPRPLNFRALLCGSLGGVALGGLTSCPGDGPAVIRGTGPLVQEQRDFRPIERIEVRGCADLSVLVLPRDPGALVESTGPETVVFLEGASDLLSWVEVTLEGRSLILRFRDDVRLDPLPSIEVQTGWLREVMTIGSGDVRVVGMTPSATRGDSLSISVTGSGDVLAEGAADALEVRHIGSGDLDLRRLKCRFVSYSGLGSGDAWVFASESLSSTLKGSGDLFLLGPVSDECIDFSAFGSAHLKRVRDR